jgi:hypothetical protein
MTIASLESIYLYLNPALLAGMLLLGTAERSRNTEQWLLNEWDS